MEVAITHQPLRLHRSEWVVSHRVELAHDGPLREGQGFAARAVDLGNDRIDSAYRQCILHRGGGGGARAAGELLAHPIRSEGLPSKALGGHHLRLQDRWIRSHRFHRGGSDTIG